MEVKLFDSMGDDLTVVNAARVSFKKHHKEFYKEKDTKLIKYLAEHKHITPFGHCFARFWVKAPIFVARQLMRHKFLRINEISRRYIDERPEFFENVVWRERPDKGIKQGSGGPIKNQSEASLQEYLAISACVSAYERLLELGVAPEQARMVLPLSTYTEWYWSGSLDAFASMCAERIQPDVQKETRWIAEQISYNMEDKFPVSWDALMNSLGADRNEEYWKGFERWKTGIKTYRGDSL